MRDGVLLSETSRRPTLKTVTDIIGRAGTLTDIAKTRRSSASAVCDLHRSPS
jgi:hypothetical protein